MKRTIVVGCLVLVSCKQYGVGPKIIQAPTEFERRAARVAMSSEGSDPDTHAVKNETRKGLNEKNKQLREAYAVCQAEKIRCAAVEKCIPVECEKPSLVATDWTNEDVFVNLDFRHGEAYCRNVMSYGQGSYRRFAGWGGVIAGVGAIGTAASVTWAAQADKGEHVGVRVGTAVATTAVAVLGAYLIKRAIGAANASGQAGLGLAPGLSDEKRWTICLDARSKWLGANASALEVIKYAAPSGASDGVEAETEDTKSEDAGTVEGGETEGGVSPAP